MGVSHGTLWAKFEVYTSDAAAAQKAYAAVRAAMAQAHGATEVGPLMWRVAGDAPTEREVLAVARSDSMVATRDDLDISWEASPAVIRAMTSRARRGVRHG